MRLSHAMLKKIALSVLIVIIAVTAFFGWFNRMTIEKTFLNRIDRSANAYLDRTMKKALVTFAIVRGLNAVISVIQDSDIAVSPAGVGVTVAVGEVLDPINDIIERFSWVMLASTTSLGIQKILMNIAIWLGFRVLLCTAMVVLLIGLWFPRHFRFDMKAAGFKLILLSVLIRFCIPLTAIATDRIDILFLNKSYQKAAETLEKVSVEIEADEEKGTTADGESGIAQKAKSFFDGIKNAINAEEKIRILKEKITNAIGYIIDLIVVFILQTILIPLLVLWLLLRFFGDLFGTNLVRKLGSAFHRSGSNKAAEQGMT